MKCSSSGISQREMASFFDALHDRRPDKGMLRLEEVFPTFYQMIDPLQVLPDSDHGIDNIAITAHAGQKIRLDDQFAGQRHRGETYARQQEKL